MITQVPNIIFEIFGNLARRKYNEQKGTIENRT